MDGIVEQIKQTVQDQLASAATQTSMPRSSTCSFCGIAGHYMCECETIATFIYAEKCKQSTEGKIVLPTGAMALCDAPGTLLRDHIKDWHQRNPGQAQMFYGIAGAFPGSSSRQCRPNSTEQNCCCSLCCVRASLQSPCRVLWSCVLHSTSSVIVSRVLWKLCYTPQALSLFLESCGSCVTLHKLCHCFLSTLCCVSHCVCVPSSLSIVLLCI